MLEVELLYGELNSLENYKHTLGLHVYEKQVQSKYIYVWHRMTETALEHETDTFAHSWDQTSHLLLSPKPS